MPLFADSVECWADLHTYHLYKHMMQTVNLIHDKKSIIHFGESKRTLDQQDIGNNS